VLGIFGPPRVETFGSGRPSVA